MADSSIISLAKIELLINESKQLTAIFTAQGKTAKNNLRLK
jgi:hypothetical protein